MTTRADALAHLLAGFLRGSVDAALRDAGPGSVLAEASISGLTLEALEAKLVEYEAALYERDTELGAAELDAALGLAGEAFAVDPP